jgi:hypothetical protein
VSRDKGERNDSGAESAFGGIICRLSGFVMELRVAVDRNMYNISSGICRHQPDKRKGQQYEKKLDAA